MGCLFERCDCCCIGVVGSAVKQKSVGMRMVVVGGYPDLLTSSDNGANMSMKLSSVFGLLDSITSKGHYSPIGIVANSNLVFIL